MPSILENARFYFFPQYATHRGGITVEFAKGLSWHIHRLLENISGFRICREMH